MGPPSGARQEINNALEIPPMRAHRDAATSIPVRARLEWEGEGVERARRHGRARWTTRAMRVELLDRRWRINAVWLPPIDITRR